jgi:hypothetical protein
LSLHCDWLKYCNILQIPWDVPTIETGRAHRECMAIQYLCLFPIKKLYPMSRLNMILDVSLLHLYRFIARTCLILGQYMWDFWCNICSDTCFSPCTLRLPRYYLSVYRPYTFPFTCYSYPKRGLAVTLLVEALRSKSEGRGFESQWCRYLKIFCPTMTLKSTRTETDRVPGIFPYRIKAAEA